MSVVDAWAGRSCSTLHSAHPAYAGYSGQDGGRIRDDAAIRVNEQVHRRVVQQDTVMARPSCLHEPMVWHHPP